MNRLLVICLIVLLPLRAWAGDLMSVQMATGGAAVQTLGAMAPDCPMHQQVQAPGVDPASSHAPSGLDACASCDLCLPVAELANAGFEAVGVAAHAKPLMGGVDFFSASPAPALEPPIS